MAVGRRRRWRRVASNPPCMFGEDVRKRSGDNPVGVTLSNNRRRRLRCALVRPGCRAARRLVAPGEGPSMLTVYAATDYHPHPSIPAHPPPPLRKRLPPPPLPPSPRHLRNPRPPPAQASIHPLLYPPRGHAIPRHSPARP